uniref:O-fucosyltransferase family protein n=1 Tax=Kalanchoe fedtschenkoi TaxID=63787 RepID=A0A7N1A972_KALFE
MANKSMKPKSARSIPPTTPLLLTIFAIFVLYILCTSSSSSPESQLLKNSTFSPKTLIKPENENPIAAATPNERVGEKKYLYWGSRIDCPGKHCDTCAGLGHQESSLRCALEEAMYLQRTFVMPSRMCINPMHNKKGILHQSDNGITEATWAASSCAMDSLYDLSLMSETVSVILDNSKAWYRVLLTSMKLEERGAAHVKGVSRVDLKQDDQYSNYLLINRTASPLSWFAECKDRHNLSAILLPHSFLPSMAANRLRDAAEKIQLLLGDYDAMHVRRGDILKTRKDRFGVPRSLHPHLDRDTRPEFIMRRIKKWVPPGRTLFIASNERTPGFFSPLSSRYKLAYSSNFSHILEPVIENNYQLFMLERLLLMKAKTYIKTYKENENDLSLTDDPKKNTKNWQIPV